MQYYDTVDIPYWQGKDFPYPSVKLRVDFTHTRAGYNFMYHCHILEHEDQGMMANIRVLPCSDVGVCEKAVSVNSGNDATDGRVRGYGGVWDAVWIGISVSIGVGMLVLLGGMFLGYRFRPCNPLTDAGADGLGMTFDSRAATRSTRGIDISSEE